MPSYTWARPWPARGTFVCHAGGRCAASGQRAAGDSLSHAVSSERWLLTPGAAPARSNRARHCVDRADWSAGSLARSARCLLDAWLWWRPAPLARRSAERPLSVLATGHSQTTDWGVMGWSYGLDRASLMARTPHWTTRTSCGLFRAFGGGQWIVRRAVEELGTSHAATACRTRKQLGFRVEDAAPMALLAGYGPWTVQPKVCHRCFFWPRCIL